MAHVYTEESNFENIANAIREKNGTDNTYAPSEMASAIEDLKVGELDFSSIYDQKQAQELNDYYKKGIAYTEEIKKDWNNPKDGSDFFRENKNIVFCPSLDFSNTTIVSNMFNLCCNMVAIPYIYSDAITIALSFFYFCSSLVNLKINIPNNTNAIYITYSCMAMVNAELGNVSKVTTFLYAFLNCYALINFRILEWKQADISLAQSSKLSAESINYIIEYALGADEGAVARTLTLNADAKKNWQASPDYEYYQAMASEKLITIA